MYYQCWPMYFIENYQFHNQIFVFQISTFINYLIYHNIYSDRTSYCMLIIQEMTIKDIKFIPRFKQLCAMNN